MRYIATNHSCISQAMRHTDEVIFEGARGCEPKFLSITVPNNLGGKDRDKYYAEYVFQYPFTK